MFRLLDSWRFERQVPIGLPDGHEESCRVEFSAISHQEAQELARRGDEELLRRVVVGWQDIVDENGQKLAFTRANLARLLSYPFVVRSLSMAYVEGLRGEMDANFAPSSALCGARPQGTDKA